MFQSPVSFDDQMGNKIEGWQPEFTVWARVQPRLGGETVMAERLAGRGVYVIHVRQSSLTIRIQPEWQAVHSTDGRIFQIKSPTRNVDEKNAILAMDAEIGIAA